MSVLSFISQSWWLRRPVAGTVVIIAILAISLAACVGGASGSSARDSGDSERKSESRTSRTSRTASSSSKESGGHGSASASSSIEESGDHEAAKGEQVHWTYDGATGPSYWGDLADEYAACKFGNSQSPINILGAINASSVDIGFHYQATPLSILNNGHTIQVNYEPGSTITLGDEDYDLLQFHFHTPSEHQVDAHTFPMEGHLVHKNKDGGLAVIGVFIEEGHSNPFFESLINYLPAHADEEKSVSSVHLNVMDLLPDDHAVYSYSGSLTTPPCSEDVAWNVMAAPIQASSEQIEAFSKIMGQNARPIQPVNARAVSGQTSNGASVVSVSTAGHGSVSADAESTVSGDAHWEYTGSSGQNYWGDISAEFNSCVDGSAQSPINIEYAIPTQLRDITFIYADTQLSLINNGHTIQANYDDGSYILVDGNRFNLLQFHFHWPSEHVVDGKQYLMEGHLVHQDAQGNLAVVGVLMERGEPNSALSDVWEFMPPTAGAVREPGILFNVNDLLPDDRTTYRYSGSLTTPPCSESVQWMVLKNPVQVSAQQAQLFEDAVGYNSRYTQPLHGREVLEDISMD